MHYNDPNQDLQDLYFIDPQWLCELMAQIVTLPEVNPYIHHGILNLENLPQIFKGEQFPHENSPQFIRLLNRFQIACSLDEERVLIPSKLPTKQPDEATNDDLPFITLKRIHSLPCIPHGFWSRLISRLLFYMKDMLSDRQEDTSPFQLDPFCCRCPLVLESSATGGLTDSGDYEVQPSPTITASIGGSLENLQGSPGDFRGLVRFFSSHRQGTYINGRFFAYSDMEGGSSRSDSGFEYSSEDDDEARAKSTGAMNATFPIASARNSSERNRRIFKHGTDPGKLRHEEKLADQESGTPKSESGVSVMRQGDLRFGVSCTSSEEGSRGTLTSEQSNISPRVTQSSSVSVNEPPADDLVDLSRGNELADVESDKDVKDTGECPFSDWKKTSYSQKLNGFLDIRPTQHYNSDDSDSTPYLSAASRSCTPDPVPREQSDEHCDGPSSLVSSENPEIGPPRESPIADDPNQFQPLKMHDKQYNGPFLAVSGETPETRPPDDGPIADDPEQFQPLTEDRLEGPQRQRSTSEDNLEGDISSASNSHSSDKESIGESFHTGSSRGSSEAGDVSMEIRIVSDDEETAGKRVSPNL